MTFAPVVDVSSTLSRAQSVTTPSRFHELDSIRGVAASIVVIHHFCYMYFYSQMLQNSALALLWYPLVAGRESVILFFLLSGFVLSVPYLRGKGQGYPVFLFRRILRIYCPYLFALALAIAANSIWHGPLPFASAWSNGTWATPVNWKDISQGIFMLGDYNWQRFNTAFWSLVVEMRISIIFPFVFLLVRKVSWRKSLFVAAGFSLVVHFDNHVGHALRNVMNSLQYITVFICGILLATHLDQLGAWYASLSRSRRVTFAAASFLFFETSHLTSRELFRGSWMIESWHVQDWPLILGAAGFMLIGLNSRSAQRLLNSRIPSFLGRISYSLYLVHGTVLFATAYMLQGRLSPAVVFLIYVPSAVLLSTVFCLLIEEPFTRLGRKLGRARRPAPQSVPVVDASDVIAA